jgi:hypothetical protein
LAEIVNSGIGGNLGGLPSWRKQQRLLDIVSAHVCNIDMVANPKKSVNRGTRLCQIRFLYYDSIALVCNMLATKLPWLSPKTQFIIQRLNILMLEAANSRRIQLECCNTKTMIADILTKPIAALHFENLCLKLRPSKA